MAETSILDSDPFSAGRPQVGLVFQETFAPILYVMKYSIFDDVLKDHTAVGARLASSIFTLDMQEPERSLSADGSDCGIANINIGAVFGGEKETGGERDSDSDAWRSYMRRATNTVNYSTDIPFAQGVAFEIE